MKLISSSCIFTINRNLAQLGAAGPNKAVSDLIPGFLRDVSCEGWGAGWYVGSPKSESCSDELDLVSRQICPGPKDHTRSIKFVQNNKC